MRKITLFLSVFTVFFISAQNTPVDREKDSLMLRNIYTQVLQNGKSYDWLHHICYQIGHRLSGSLGLEKMINYTQKELKKLDVDVRLQPVKVPNWVRGLKEYAYIKTSNGKTTQVPILALGGSVATPSIGIQGKVIEFKSLEELRKSDINDVIGKIVFLNGAMPPEQVNTFEAYGVCGNQRFSGAKIAVEKGAIAVIVRSLGLKQDDFPHTGMMSYGDLPRSKQIPAASISTNGANLLSSILSLDSNTEFYFKQNCKTLPDVPSYNVIAEIIGSEFPDEIITIGGHNDSWDVGQGAHDDGAGVVQCMEIFRVFKKINYRPKRTLRVVLFTNEENGVRGGRKYAEESKAKGENHILALESDSGGLTPRGFNLMGTKNQIQKVRGWKSLFEPYYIHLFEEGHPGTDISPLKNKNTLLVGLVPDSQRYFDFHHSEADVFEAVNKRELELGAAAIISFVYLIDKYGLE